MTDPQPPFAEHNAAEGCCPLWPMPGVHTLVDGQLAVVDDDDAAADGDLDVTLPPPDQQPAPDGADPGEAQDGPDDDAAGV